MKMAGTKSEVAHNPQTQPMRKEPFSFADGLCSDMLCTVVYVHGHSLSMAHRVC